MKEILGSASTLSFGGYNPKEDVSLAPNNKKVSAIIHPLTRWKFEDIISMFSN